MVCGRILLSKRAETKRIRDDAAREKQEGIQGQWQQKSPFREILSRLEEMKTWGGTQKLCVEATTQKETADEKIYK